MVINEIKILFKGIILEEVGSEEIIFRGLMLLKRLKLLQ